MSELSLKGIYSRESANRDPYLTRGYDTAALCIPSLLPRDGHSGANLPTPYQATGARGTNTISARQLMTLFPPGLGFMRHASEPLAEREVAAEQVAKLKRTLAEVDLSILGEFEAMNIRPQIHECLKQLQVAGNVLLKLDDKRGATVHRLSDYVVCRDPYGRVEKIVIEEEIRPVSLPDEIREMITPEMGDKPVTIYTGVMWDPDTKKYEVWQEALEVFVKGTKGSFTEDAMPYLALWTEPVFGENYGYGYITSYLGDLVSLEGLSQALIEAASASAKVVLGVKVSSVLDEQELADAKNLDVLRFDEGDIHAFRAVEKSGDLQVVFGAVNQLRSDLSVAFLENRSAQRSGERVTAFEISKMVDEMESVMAGTYPLLAKTLQRPIALWIKRKLTRTKAIPKIPENIARISVITGLEALGRGADLQRLDSFVMGAQQTFGPEALGDHIDISDYLTRRGTALGLNTDGLVREAEEVQALQQQRQQAQLMQSAAGPAITAAASAGQQQPQQ